MDSECSAEEKVLQNYVTSANVRARWHTYRLAREPVDIEKAAYRASLTDDDDTIADIGSSDGQFIERTEIEFGHTGQAIAVDVKPSQFIQTQQQPITDQLLRDRLLLAQPYSKIPRQLGGTSLDRALNAKHFMAVAGDVSALPFKTGSIDRVFELFMLYHVLPKKINQSLHESKRVLNETGRLIIATSGADNKLTHRENEATISENLGVLPPLVMNSSFTTERAIDLIPEFFNGTNECVYIARQDTDMVLRTKIDVDLYIQSQQSLYDQYRPIPNMDAFKEELQDLRFSILKHISKHGEYLDRISRSVIVASKAPMNIGRTAMIFTRIA